ncbi:MAG: type secretion system ATPase, FliI/YscN [Phycisphaerales bacterium]|nr:type secretion system ATPase, FliI/YscN [Phycisphaerales bacterium]
MSVLEAHLDAVDGSMPFRVVGQVAAVTGMTVEAADLTLPLGSLCRIDSFGGKSSNAEVIGFRADRTLLMPLTNTAGVSRGDKIENIASAPRIWCSEQLLGRVINGFGKPIDGKGPLRLGESRRIDNRSPAPMDRENIRQPIATSIRAIDGLHTCGLGQRMGIFSGPGVGKSMLMSMIAKNTSADISVIALIGERGREVQEFLHTSLDPGALARCVVIVATAEEAPLLRVRAAKVACTVSEYFRDRGKHVLLLMDSLTRLCHAQRQIGLSAHEPPATKGFPPSVFALLPEILERAGKSAAGSITGFYTVLVEGDDFNEPIPDAVKGITDGHLWLSRALANRGHYPAIDVLQSISRVRGDVATVDHLRAARRVLALTAVYHDIEDLVNIGAYMPGMNAEFDLAVQMRPHILQFLQQEPTAPCPLEQSRQHAMNLLATIETLERNLRAQAQAKAAAVRKASPVPSPS